MRRASHASSRASARLPTTEEKQAPGRRRSTGTTDDPICPVTPAHAAILKLRLLTAQRGGEIARMRWADVDLNAGWWTIPAMHTKNKRSHRVPLTARAGAILTAIKAAIPADETPEAVFSAGESATDRAKKAPTLVARALDLDDFRGHDLRRTAATKMGEAGIPRQDIAYVLNHIDGAPRATQVYDRFERDKEKRIALDTWERTLTAILDKKPAGAVVPFVKGA